jgi:hypothetical protein
MPHRFVRHMQQRAGASASDRVTALEGWLDDHPWAYWVGVAVMVGAWCGAWGVLDADPTRAQVAGAGLLAIIGGVCEVFLAKPLAQWRDSQPWWRRLWNEGAWGAVDAGPASYRFWGSAAVGAGVGALSWAAWPHETAAIAVGIVACLAVWMWTWFAFPAVDGD